jgi:hypothetical protein
MYEFVMAIGYSCISFYQVTDFTIPEAMQQKANYFEII